MRGGQQVLPCPCRRLEQPAPSPPLPPPPSTLIRSVGLAGTLASFALLSSVLTLAGGAVAVATMPGLEAAAQVARGRRLACSSPRHSANLAIAATVFGVLECFAYAAVFAKFFAADVRGTHGGGSDSEGPTDDPVDVSAAFAVFM